MTTSEPNIDYREQVIFWKTVLNEVTAQKDKEIAAKQALIDHYSKALEDIANLRVGYKPRAFRNMALAALQNGTKLP